MGSEVSAQTLCERWQAAALSQGGASSQTQRLEDQQLDQLNMHRARRLPGQAADQLKTNTHRRSGMTKNMRCLLVPSAHLWTIWMAIRMISVSRMKKMRCSSRLHSVHLLSIREHIKVASPQNQH